MVSFAVSASALSTSPDLSDAAGPGSARPDLRLVLRPGIVPPAGPMEWTPACAAGVLVPGRGVAVLLPDSRQAAVFLLPNGMIYAIDNLDPFSGAAVLSRGLTGDHDGEPYVASPLLKQRFSLRTGLCLDEGDVRVSTYSVRVLGGIIRVGAPAQTQARAA